MGSDFSGRDLIVFAFRRVVWREYWGPIYPDVHWAHSFSAIPH
ncbi:hypothetical protein GGR49_002655 [Sphingomonas carotinifaciens]|nr:hypothetical protein [Sphingomonas carotinifaciens]